MKENLRFWRGWRPEHRSVLMFGFSLGVAALLLMLLNFIRYPENVIPWSATAEEEHLEVPAYPVKAGPFTLEVKADSYLRWETFSGSAFQLDESWFIVYLILFTAGLSLLLALQSTLSRFWFLSTSGLVVFIVAAQRPEGLFGAVPLPYYTIAVSIAWLGTGAFILFRHPSMAFIKRAVIFTLLTGTTFGFLILLSPEPEPWLYLAAGSIPGSVIIALVFLILVAHEIQAGMLYLIARSGRNRNGLRDFLILSVIYLINVLAIYLSDMKIISWAYAPHPLLLLAVSGCLGIWGIRRQQDQIGGFLPAEPYGVLMMVALAIITFGSIGFWYATGNDPLFTTFRNLSLYVHIGYGVIFIAYVVANFGALLTENAPVYKVLYQPTVMPFFTYRFGGLVATLGFVFYNMWIRPVNDTIGGYYNAVADQYLLTDRLKLAEGYYKMSTRYAYFNHHSNYLLAGMEAEKGNAGRYKKYLSDATGRRPIPQTYINLGDLMLADQRTLDAYTWFSAGLDRFPGNAYLLNAIGVTNHLLGSEDSARRFLGEAIKSGGPAGAAANRNRFAVLAKLQGSIDPDSLWKAAEDPSARSNAAAFASRNDFYLPVTIPVPADSILDDPSATLLNNMLVNHMDSLPEADIRRFAQLINRKENGQYAESLLLALSHAAYRQGMATDAFQLAERALFTTENKGRYNNLLAIWALDQGASETAIRYSDFAIQQGYPDALLTRAVILAEAGRKAEAAIAWDSLAKGKNKLLAMMSDLSKRALLLDASFLGKLSDQERYAYCRYHIGALDSVTFRKATGLITNDDLRARAIYDRAERLYRNGELKKAIGTYSMLEGIPLSDENLYHDIRMLELLMLAARREYSAMAKQINNNFRFRRTEEPEKRYFTALLSLQDTATAGRNLRWIGEHNLFFEDGVIALAAFHRQFGTNKIKDYDLLARALHNNPTSVKLLKEFIRATVRLGFEVYNQQAFEDLQRLVGPAEYNRFLRSIPPPEKTE